MVLFAKEKSSLQSLGGGGDSSQQQQQHNKKGKDSTLRKSDRRQLLQRVLQVLSVHGGNSQDKGNNDNNNGGGDGDDDYDNYKNNSNDSFSIRQLRHIFLQGTLVQRTLVIQPTQDAKKSDKKVMVYYRGPDDAVLSDGGKKRTMKKKKMDDDEEDDDDNDEDHLLWPYKQLTQAVWIELDKQLQLPTVALLSVLLLSSSSTATTATATNNGDMNESCPILPTVTIFPNVSRYLCRGADLMMAGIAKIVIPPDPLSPSRYNDKNNKNNNNNRRRQSHQQKDQQPFVRNHNNNNMVCMIQIQGNPQPFAVALLTQDLLSQPWGPGTKGVAALVQTCYGDDLWRQQLPITSGSSSTTHVAAGKKCDDVENGSSVHNLFDLGHYGNPGFLDGNVVAPIVVPVKEQQDKDEDQHCEPPPEISAMSCMIDGDSTGGEDPPNGLSLLLESKPLEKANTGVADVVPNGKVPEDQNPKDELSVAAAAVKEELLSPEDILHQATCRALVQLHPKHDLPLKMAQFYSQHVLKQQQGDGGNIQLKQTRYKKFGVYVQEQVDRELIQVGPDASKKDTLAMLIGYDPRHPDLIPFVEEKKKVAMSSNATHKEQKMRLVLADLYCIPQHFVNLLRLDSSAVQAANATSDERKGTGFLTVKEVRVILDDYVEREQLVDPNNQALVLLDGPLTDALFKKKQKKPSTSSKNSEVPSPAPAPPPTSLARKQLVTKWQDKMEVAYALVEMPGNRVIKLGRGAPPKVRIEVYRRQSKKFCTKVRGMELYGVNPQELRQHLAQRFACAVALEEDVPGLPNQCVELQLQGNFVDEVEATLIGDPSLTDHGGAKDSPYQLPPKAMKVYLGKGVPFRKKRTVASKKK